MDSLKINLDKARKALIESGYIFDAEEYIKLIAERKKN